MVIPVRGQKRSTYPQDMRPTWSRGRTCSGGDGNALLMPERERQTRDRHTGGGKEQEEKVHVCVQAHMHAFGSRQG